MPGMNTSTKIRPAAHSSTTPRLFRLPTVLDSRGIKHSQHWEDIQAELFTKPVKVGRVALWPENEVAALNAARIAGKSDDQIRQLVRALHAARATALDAVMAATGV